ncbi:MAG: molybdopterin-binding protein, partial [Sulfolobales archaeon]
MNLTPERIKMAYMPRSARPLPNPVGIAPGILVERENLIIIALPGVPSEMEGIWENHVEPYLRRFGRRRFAETTIRLVGVPESSLARIINSFVRNRGNVYVKSHPKGHEIRGPVIDLYIMTSTESSEDPSIECAKNCKELLELLERENPELMIEGECICKPNIA